MSSKIQLAVGLDAGSGRTRCVICVIENGGIRYLAHGLAPAAGWVKGRMSDPVAVAESIHAAVTDAERGAQVSVECRHGGHGRHGSARRTEPRLVRIRTSA